MRALLGIISVSVILLVGCGSSPAPIIENTGTGPKPAPGQPSVTDVSPATVTVGGPSFKLTVTGQNFAQGDKVQWDNNDLDSTFISSTKMTAQVPHAFLYEPESAFVSVQTPTPNSLNFGTNLIVTSAPAPGSAGFTVSSVSVKANDMAWDPKSGQIYLSTQGTDPSYPNSILALNPATGQFGLTTGSGTGASQLAVSSDGSMLYAGVDANGSIQRYALPGLTKDITIDLGSVSGKPYYALAIQTAPGDANTIAVGQTPSLSQPEKIVIYDGAVARPSTAPNPNGYVESLGSLAWNATGSSLYASFDGSYASMVSVFSVNSTGVSLVVTGNATLGAIHYSKLTGYLYNDKGAVIDAGTGAKTDQLYLASLGSALTLDNDLGMAWVAGQSYNGQYVVQAFDLRTYALLGSITLPNVAGTPVKLIRWGTDGLAFLTSGSSSTQGGLYIVKGPFVTTPSLQ